jgi:hypothetical protein
VKVSDPDSVPVAVGVKVTETVQLAPAGRLEGQAVVSAKLPEAVTPRIERASVPVFVSVAVASGLVELRAWLPNVRDAGAALAPGVGVAEPGEATELLELLLPVPHPVKPMHRSATQTNRKLLR